MAQPDTVTRLLDAAECLFAERGFAETSLRQITGRAGVNLAAVNYHFGSKKTLIQAVFARFLTPFCLALDAALDRRLAAGDGTPLDLDALFRVVADTALELNARDPVRGARFMRLTGLAYTESQGHLRRWLAVQYGPTFARLQRLVEAATPGIAREEMFWRFHFALGSMVFTLSGLSSLQGIAEADFAHRRDFRDVVQRLLAFASAGIRQEASRG